jgi:hypothetical protein
MTEDSCCHGHGHDCEHDHGSAPAAQNGVANPAVLDALGRDPQTGELVLVMMEPRPWSGGDEQLLQLQEKLNAYLSFALDGELAEQLPQFAGAPMRIQLACAEPPPEPVIGLLEKIREQIAFQGIGLEVSGLARGEGGGSCGEGCGCH